MKTRFFSLFIPALLSLATPLLGETLSRTEIFDTTHLELVSKGFVIDRMDTARPWGGFFVIEESQAPAFAQEYFDQMDAENLKIAGKLSPKILLIAPGKRLSWQYHLRRAEIWRVLSGHVGVITSSTNEEAALKVYEPGQIICIKPEERHRLIGLETWSIVAEIWQHTDSEHSSDEADIVRVQDDFGR